MPSPYQDYLARFTDQLVRRPETVVPGGRPTRRGKPAYRSGRPDALVIAGMGGSGLAGDLVRHFRESLRLPIPVIVWKGFGLPPLPFKQPLVIAVSHSGNTAETRSAFEAAVRRGYEVGVAATGGALLRAARARRIPHAVIPTLPGLTPREGIGYTYFALVELLRTWFPHLRNPDVSRTVRASSLERMVPRITKVIGRNSVSVFAPLGLEVVGYVWKIVLLETAKRLATLEVLPEAAHNTIVGFTRRPERTSALFLSSAEDDRGEASTARVVQSLIARGGTPVLQIPLRGETLESRSWNGILLGHLVALSLATRNKLDPSATLLTNEVKRRLGR